MFFFVARHTQLNARLGRTSTLVHLPDQLVDVGLAVTKVTTLNVVLEFACSPTTSGVRQLEGPQEI
jgi:hypothetical protein